MSATTNSGSDADRVIDALSFIPPDDRDVWVRMAMAVKSELGEAGFEVWDKWSQAADSYTAADARDVWKSIRANGKVTAGTLYHMAMEHGWTDQGERRKPTAEEQAARERQAKERQAREEEAAAKERERTATNARAILKASAEAAGDNPHLAAKGVQPTATMRETDVATVVKLTGWSPRGKRGLLQGRLLVIPIKVGAKLSTLELIDGDGRKASLPGHGTKSEGLWAAQTAADAKGAMVELIGEGAITSATVREATSYPAFAALAGANLVAAAKARRLASPKATLGILADLDKETGLPCKYALKAAEAVGGVLLVPDFGPERDPDSTDWNDLAKLQGLDEVKRQIAAQLDGPAGPIPGPGPEDDAAGKQESQATPGPGGKSRAEGDTQQLPWEEFVLELASLSEEAYDAIRKEAARKRGVRLKETLDKAVMAERKRLARQKKGGEISEFSGISLGVNPYDPFESSTYAIRTHSTSIRKSSIHSNQALTESVSERVPVGALLQDVGTDRQQRMIESHAAEVLAKALRGALAWDRNAQAWSVWHGTHWEPRLVGGDAEAVVAAAVHLGTHPLGYRVGYLNGVTQVMQRRGLLALPPPPVGVVPFANGLLDIATGALVPPTPDRALSWCLPHHYDETATCPTILEWLHRCVDDDEDTVFLLVAWLAALLRGISLQKFLLLLGRGGTGKGTFQRLAVALVGERNVAVCTMRALEENRFETAKLYGKLLCMLNEVGRYGGSLNMFKAILGDDHIPLERKHVQQEGSFRFFGQVALASNEDLVSSDSTSGLERRRVTVRFRRTATPEERADWARKGGEAAVLHAEIPGLINLLLKLSADDIRAAFEAPPERVALDNMLGMSAGNSVADWMVNATVPEVGAEAQVGSAGMHRYAHTHDWLYPNYLAWCEAEGRRYPVSLRKFAETIVDLAEHMGHDVKQGRDPVLRHSVLHGIRLRNTSDEPMESVWVKSLIRRDLPESNGFGWQPNGSKCAKSLIRMNRADSGSLIPRKPKSPPPFPRPDDSAAPAPPGNPDKRMDSPRGSPPSPGLEAKPPFRYVFPPADEEVDL